MSFTLPNRPLPDDPRVIADLLENFDYVAALINNGLDLSSSFVNSSIDLTELTSGVKDRIGVNTNSRHTNSAVNEVTTVTADLDTTVDAVIAIPDVSKTILCISFKSEQKASDGATTVKVSLRDETDNVELTSNTTVGRTTYASIDKTSFVVPCTNFQTTTGNHTFGIHLHRVSGAGTAFVRARGFWAVALVLP